MIKPEIRAEIVARLEACEEQHDVRIVYCAESGSRAWGSPRRIPTTT